jgi:uncharacterized membrane protein
MANPIEKFLSGRFLAVVVALQVIMYVSLFLNFPFVRLVVGIVYLTIVPGLIFIKLLKLDELGTLETIVFAVGFSIAFLMLAGLVINQFGYAAGLSFPLSTLPLSLFINTLIIVGAAAVYLRQGKSKKNFTLQGLRISPYMLILTLIPVLSLVGVYIVNTTGNSLILVIMILSIAALLAFTAFRERSSKFYSFAIFMIAIALLMHVSLITNYIVPYGSDSPAEYYVFQTVQQNGHWSPVFAFAGDQNGGRFNAMLSITVLPTVFSNMLGMDPSLVFKLLYPLIFALVPVALYLLWTPYIGKKLGFIAAFVFVAQSTFFTEMIALNRQMIAELFFVLLLLVLLNKKVKKEGKFLSFAILSFGLIFSHYALAEIFLGLIFAAWAVSAFYLKKPNFNLQLSMIIFFFVAMFAWYIYTSGAVVFDSFITFTRSVTSQFGDFLNPASRGGTVLTGLGLVQAPSVLNTVSRVFAYLTEIFIVLGVVSLIRKKNPFRFERDFAVFGIIAIAILISLTVVPGLANTLSMTRFYHILLMILAPFCVVGMWTFSQVLCKFVFKNQKKLIASLIVVAVLVPYFLFQTNLIYEVAGTESWSIPLSGYRMNPIQLYGYFGLIDSYSVHGAQWVSANVPYKNNLVSDNGFYTALTAYGVVYNGYVTALDPNIKLHSGEFLYLSYISIGFENLISNESMAKELPRIINQTDVIYSNGGTEIRYTP